MPEMRLRVGLLCSGTRFQRWQAEAIRQVLAVPGVELVLLITPGETATAPAKRHWGTALYRRYRHRHFKVSAMQEEELEDLLKGLPRLACVPQRVGIAEHFSPADLERIRSHRPDVLLRFGFNILGGDILTLPRHGVWSYHHGDPAHFRGGPPGFWEIMQGAPITGAVLQRLTDTLDAGRILRQGWFHTVDHSLAETVDTVLGHSTHWPAQVMRELLAGVADAAEGRVPTERGKLYRYPGNLSFLHFLWKQFNNKLRFHRKELEQHEEWNIGILHQPIHELLRESPNLNVRWLPAPAAGQFRADPFGYTDAEGRINVLHEKYEHSTGLGEIARLRPKADNILKRSRSMLATGKHLSYPYVVQHAGAVYVVPEQAAEGTVQLYRVSADNDALEPLQVLLHEALYDPTLIQHAGRWWLFGSKAPLTNTGLYLYHSERLEGPYTPHPQNPVKLDVRSARPAGTPFVHQGELWRPGQDSSLTYGGRIAMNRVLELSPTRYVEETVQYVGPIQHCAWDKGLHTLCAMGDITLVDGKRFVTVPERKKAVKQRKLDKLKRKGT
ncbi:MAG: hypothetical protein KF905_12990 [Flavobacteriales bacterium]|nr:hypothetical protein [Flavobacteriales bacterium]